MAPEVGQWSSAKYLIFILKHKLLSYLRQSKCRGTNVCVNATVVSSIRTERNELLFINIIISSLGYQSKARR